MDVSEIAALVLLTCRTAAQVMELPTDDARCLLAALAVWP